MIPFQDLGDNRGLWVSKVLGFDGFPEGLYHHKIDGIGTLQATRLSFIYGLITTKIRSLPSVCSIGVAEKMDTVNQRNSLRLQQDVFQVWNIRDLIILFAGLGLDLHNPGGYFIFISKDRGGGKLVGTSGSNSGIVINGTEEGKDQGKARVDYQGKGKGKVYEEEQSHWVKVGDKSGGRDTRNRENFRGEDRVSNYRNVHRDRARERERSPRIHRDRYTSRRYDAARKESSMGMDQPRVQDRREEETLLEATNRDDVGQEVKNAEDGLPAEDNLDLANEVLEAMYITEKDEEGMELDGVEPQVDLVEAGKEDDGFQDLTDTEEEVKNNDNHDSLATGDVGAKDTVQEEGEFVQDTVEGEEGKKHGLKKKPFRAGTAAAGGTSKLRMVQAIIAHSKRASAKNGAR
ncbi:unnamed protein product [Eruca vesicaria subsp. sativa]|uniref:Uncharacterized protein n=1 Tax=Eruca vesicaria subsp. sativa TaxID=29727 RepID=A0ABC8KMR7_ERUVS|nr:unnamed protein product [Eruca vesicaria subsp. sativa]